MTPIYAPRPRRSGLLYGTMIGTILVVPLWCALIAIMQWILLIIAPVMP